jgi:hypothetical protein
MLVSKRCGNLAGLEIIPVTIGKIEYQKESFTSYNLPHYRVIKTRRNALKKPPREPSSNFGLG